MSAAVIAEKVKTAECEDDPMTLAMFVDRFCSVFSYKPMKGDFEGVDIDDPLEDILKLIMPDCHPTPWPGRDGNHKQSTDFSRCLIREVAVSKSRKRMARSNTCRPSHTKSGTFLTIHASMVYCGSKCASVDGRCWLMPEHAVHVSVF